MKNRIPIIWNGKTFILLFFGFIAFTVIGTLTHECGHYLVGKYLGCAGGRIGYGYTITGKNKNWEPLIKIWKQYRTEIKNGTDFPGRKEFEIAQEKYSKGNFMMEAGGPLETILTGSIGLILIFVFKKKFLDATELNLWQWLLVLITLFWLRGTFNLFFWTARYLITGKKLMVGDEFYLSRYLGLGTWTLAIASAIAGIWVLTYIIFKIVPLKQRFTFVCAGLSGGLTGAILWLGIVGPRIMP